MPIVVFYLFAAIVLLMSLYVISNRNPVYSVLSLIVCFIFSSFLFLLIGAEYLAMTFIIVYVGAVTVLFLFVVMMLDIQVEVMRHSIAKSWPFMLLFLGGFSLILYGIFFNNNDDVLFEEGSKIILSKSTAKSIPNTITNTMTNTKIIGSHLYTDYILQFQLAGILLLVAMIGAIVLALHRKKKLHHTQNIKQQLARNSKTTVRLVDVESRSGVKEIK